MRRGEGGRGTPFSWSATAKVGPLSKPCVVHLRILPAAFARSPAVLPCHAALTWCPTTPCTHPACAPPPLLANLQGQAAVGDAHAKLAADEELLRSAGADAAADAAFPAAAAPDADADAGAYAGAADVQEEEQQFLLQIQQLQQQIEEEHQPAAAQQQPSEEEGQAAGQAAAEAV